MVFIPDFLNSDHLVMWSGYSGRCVDRFTGGLCYTISQLFVEIKEMRTLALKQSRKRQEEVDKTVFTISFLN
jgi:hypothetical protein